MPTMIEIAEANYVDANLVHHIEVLDSTVAIYIGEPRTADKRINVPCKSKDDAKLQAMQIAEAVTQATK